ncbi:tumor necrosis factor ligand superfamily member 14 [Anoplopoma fimbria]|uniref:tumor necrosis factor ligand superfamily member 14 n=1 Tax=Anoplopoma fimbria TaxID=229290 RepID=UPI0023ED5C63|nr:tumor necrosis factor ligand superfamily member 14 [Anoplopoma fimbria]
MSNVGYPSVCVVDTHTTRPAVPPRMTQEKRRAGPAQILLFLLVTVALCGLVIEACFIYRLYQPEAATSASFSKLSSGQGITPTPKTRSLVVLPSKPVAHLTDGQDVVHGKQIMAWSMNADPLLHEMDYKDNSLVILKEGYYYVYSKVSFIENKVFNHSIKRNTDRYFGNSIPLLMSRTFSKRPNQMRLNSYLAGVFHLTKGDAIFVEVSNTSHIARFKSYENIFGAYMI